MKKIVLFILLTSILCGTISLLSAQASEISENSSEREIIEEIRSEFVLLIGIYNEHIAVLRQILANKIARLRTLDIDSAEYQYLQQEIEKAQQEIDEADARQKEFGDIAENPERKDELTVETYNKLKDLLNTIKYSEFVYFASGSIKLTTQGMLTLKEFKLYIGDKKNFVIQIVGHADDTPLKPELIKIYKDNEGLSLARAESVYEYLTKQLNIPESIIILEGKSSLDPVSTKKALNRRVELILKPRRIK
ncbi:MAG: OmpA family protein [Candidatus Cloacimonetes bacterium]|nr:OmpA family protein [Candidatus Cloacimonadota bacterium]